MLTLLLFVIVHSRATWKNIIAPVPRNVPVNSGWGGKLSSRYKKRVQQSFALAQVFIAFVIIKVSTVKIILLVFRKYDLKGSTVDREASDKEKEKELPTLKDNDFVKDGTKVVIGDDAKERLMETLTADVEVACSHICFSCFVTLMLILPFKLKVSNETPNDGLLPTIGRSRL